MLSADPMTALNDTTVPALADALASQLLPSGFDYFVIDGGWTTSKVTFENGSSYMKQNLDEWGRPIPAPERYKDMKALADKLHARGLKIGLWTIRGAHVDAVARKLPIKGTKYTIDQIIDTHSKPGAGMKAPPGAGGANMSCLWAAEWLGVNGSHPAAQAYCEQNPPPPFPLSSCNCCFGHRLLIQPDTAELACRTRRQPGGAA